MTPGSCLCEAVSFEVDRFATDVFKCHCSKCRKAFGGASSAAVMAPEDAFRWTGGKESRAAYRSESGYGRSFCTRCGSILPIRLQAAQLYWIPAGLLGDAPELALGRHLHTDSKASWEVLDPDTEKLPEGFEF